MNNHDEQLLRVSFMLAEQGKDLETLTAELKQLYSQVNVGDSSIIVRVKLTEQEIIKLMKMVRTKDDFMTRVEVEKIKKSTIITERVWIIIGAGIVAIASHIPELISFIKSILGK